MVQSRSASLQLRRKVVGANATWVLGGMRTRISIALAVSITCFTTPSMGAESGRVDALALPSPHYRTEMTDDDRAKVEDYRKLRDFIEKNAPGAQVMIVPTGSIKERIAEETGLERLPFTYDNNSIFIRRRPVFDRKVRGST